LTVQRLAEFRDARSAALPPADVALAPEAFVFSLAPAGLRPWHPDHFTHPHGELAKALGNRRLIGHDLKSLGGGARYGLLAAADGLDLRHDTMVGAYLLDPARRTYDLIDIAAQRGLAAASKEADSADGDQLELGEEPPPDPAAEARLVWEIAQLQRKGIEEGGLEQLMDEVEMPLIEVLAAMEQNGVLLDQKRLADIGEGFEQRIETLQAEIFELAGAACKLGDVTAAGGMERLEPSLAARGRSLRGLADFVAGVDGRHSRSFFFLLLLGYYRS